MNKSRLEAFSDGVFAIIITIMVLELKAPHEASLEAIKPLIAPFIAYVLSFIYVGIYWNNHHHLFHATKHVSGGILWANLHLLFWLSLIPVVTNWTGDTHFGTWPVAAYGVVLFMSALAWEILRRLLIRKQGRESILAKALKRDYKEKLSSLLYALGIGFAFIPGWGGIAASVVYACVAAIWFIPDRRIERALLSE